MEENKNASVKHFFFFFNMPFLKPGNLGFQAVGVILCQPVTFQTSQFCSTNLYTVFLEGNILGNLIQLFQIFQRTLVFPSSVLPQTFCNVFLMCLQSPVIGYLELHFRIESTFSTVFVDQFFRENRCPLSYVHLKISSRQVIIEKSLSTFNFPHVSLGVLGTS